MTRAGRLEHRTRITLTALLAVLSLWATVVARAAEAPRPTAALDLHYGEVLFHFQQDDYFPAITHLLAAQDRGQLPHHADEAQLLLGGMYVSYGMHAAAGDLFQRVLDRGASAEVRNRAWFYLAKIAYERGFTDRARAALTHVEGPLPKAMQGQEQLLRAQVAMAEGRYAEAAAVLRTWEGARHLEPYARFNLGVALIRGGETVLGSQLLDGVGNLKSRNAEQDALRDKANLALGYSLLQREDPEAARKVLERVRLDGPFSAKALLGFGWAYASLGQYERALVPWTELRTRDAFDPAVQESLLAVPYAFGRLEAHAEAARRYQGAIDAYAGEAARVQAAIEAIRAGQLIAALLDTQAQDDMGWFWRLRQLPDTPQTRYLLHLLARHEFQEALKNYRDLSYLRRNLERWSADIDAYDDMLATRSATYARVLPRAGAMLQTQPLRALGERRERLAARLADIERSGDPLGLATQEEADRLARLDAIGGRLARLPQDAQTRLLLEKQQRLRGVLVWQVHAQFKARLWQARKSLRALDAALSEARASGAALAEAQRATPRSFTGYDSRIAALRTRIAQLLPRVVHTQTAQGAHIEALAVAELEAQQARLQTYQVQARLALAQVYDRASAGAEAAP